MTTIVLDHVVKAFGPSLAVNDVSFTVDNGEFVSLLGPSGCGKTTTLRIIAGFVEATRGRILFGTRDVTRLPPNQRNTGMVFQGFALFPHLTVAGNVAYGLHMRRRPKPEIAERVGAALDRVQLSRFADRLPKQLSGGQQQRVALARALVINPDVLLLDEPLSALDAKLRLEVRQQIRLLQQELGFTTIFVTHDQEEALSLSDRLVVMSNGIVEQTGSPATLYERPATAFVADFIGRCNFLEGAMEGAIFRSECGSALRVEAGAERRGSSRLAFRPEKAKLLAGAGDAAPPTNCMRGTVEFASYFGPATDYSIRLADGPLVQVRQQNGRSMNRPLHIGQPVMLVVEPTDCMLF